MFCNRIVCSTVILVSCLCRRPCACVPHVRQALKEFFEKLRKPPPPCCLSRRAAAGTDPCSSSAVGGSRLWIPERKKSKQTEQRCELIRAVWSSGNSSLTHSLFHPHATQQGRRCTEKTKLNKKPVQVRAHVTGWRTKRWGLMCSGRGQRELLLFCSKGVKAKALSKQTAVTQTEEEEKNKKKPMRAQKTCEYWSVCVTACLP